jgi:hypothetical protein
MKKINNYWIDSNSNKWYCDLYTEEQADKLSKTLIDCFNCINCSSCRYCSDCSDCHYCRSCRDCSYCSDCSSCSHCRSCRYCSDCSHCSYCRYCSDCSYCRDCSYCSSCSDFKSNPQRITSHKIGSRESQTTYYWNEEKEQIVCGCFKGTLQEFKDAIKNEHKDNEHSKAYFKWIEAVEGYKSLIK